MTDSNSKDFEDFESWVDICQALRNDRFFDTIEYETYIELIPRLIEGLEINRLSVPFGIGVVMSLSLREHDKKAKFIQAFLKERFARLPPDERYMTILRSLLNTNSEVALMLYSDKKISNFCTCVLECVDPEGNPPPQELVEKAVERVIRTKKLLHLVEFIDLLYSPS